MTDPLSVISAHSTSSAHQASDNTAIDCSSCSLVDTSASSPGSASASGVKKNDGLKASADHQECPSVTDPESHQLYPLQQQQQQHRRKRKRKGKAMWKAFYTSLLCSLATATLVFVAYHHYHTTSHWAGPKGDGDQKGATATSTAGPDARGPSTPAPSLSSAGEQRMDWIQVSIDMLAVPNCTTTSTSSSSGTRVASSVMPCKVNSRYITSDAEALAPLRCVDDAFLERPSGRNNCNAEATRRAFQLLASEGRVRVTQPGLYQLIGHVTVRLREAAELHFGVAVNQQLPFLCTVQSHGTGEDQPVPYSHCSVGGLRRLRAGDEVWLMVPHGNIPLQSLYRSTFLQVVRLSR